MGNFTPSSTPTQNPKQHVVEMKKKALHASSDALFLIRVFARTCQQGMSMSGLVI